MIYGLTYLGVIHTLISLVAVVAALIAFVRDKRIVPESTLGKTYVWATLLTCLTGFGIFQHGGFGKPHVLGIVTLVVLGLAWLADQRRFGARSLAVSTVCYSLTFFFHMIPAVTESTTRLPYGAPLLPNADAPELQTITGAMFLLFLVGVVLQLRRLKQRGAPGGLPA
ncbi:hypothetical protein GJ697_24360 [Pseudoduganella sp. FT25W]|uniref:DUF2306 domain-containing protein n=1 Tax=Duganella alba TaxID=2666081 RepID=A0A6L5QMG7_9BURK|nr:hypothetical protein [Duganella alba]MRX10960.1 hypothetical protein [Duganella alba]MRX19082.1 hypothetical protein [Duganella alba]